jgi:alanine dehydrogenase
VRKLAGLGVTAALADDPGMAAGLNTHAGTITYDGVAAAFI